MIRKHHRSFRLALLAVAGTLAGLSATQAGPPATGKSSPPAVSVRYDDLDLASDAGVRRLYARLRHAATRVCPDAHDRQLDRAIRTRACQAQAVDAAVAQLQNPRLAVLHAGGGARS